MDDAGPARTRRARPVRAKLDPRLAYLLTLPVSRLRALKAAEDGRRQRVLERIAAGHRALDAARNEAEAQERAARLETLYPGLFAPVSTGVYFPTRHPSAPWPTSLKEPSISAFVLSDASARDLARLGLRVRSQAGDIFTAFIPLARIAALEASPAIRFIELGRPLFPTLDQALSYTEVAALHNAAPPIRGAGVIVGIVDIGQLDVYHPDFRTASDATRVRFLWDQTLVPQTGESPPTTAPDLPGVEYDEAAINAELAHPAGTPAYQIVRHGGQERTHGTFVTGIATGNGRGGNGTFTGAAPDAEIIFVMIPIVDPGRFGDHTLVADAFAYIFARAAELGRPCVVNMSASDNLGPHDGTLLGEQFLDELLLTPGRAVTLSAGNSNNTASHAVGIVAEGATKNLVVRYAAGASNTDGIEIWYDGHDRFSATVTVPGLGAPIGPVPHGTTVKEPLPSGGEVSVASGADERSGDNLVSLEIVVPEGGAVPAGDWTIGLTGETVINGRFHAWIDRNNRDQVGWLADVLQEDHLTIGVPATTRRALAVGAHNKTAPTPTINLYSGRGPARDGRVKPDLATVGNPTAARARNMNLADPGNLYVSWGTGTSWAAALTAGATALLLECRGPATTAAAIKQILQDTAATVGLGVPGKAFGFGSLRMASACGGALPSVDVWIRSHESDTGLEPFTGPVAWLSPDIEILDAGGIPVPNPRYHPTYRYNNIVRVTLRNRGSQTARNTVAYLYWADPATFIPFPAAWDASGIYTPPPGQLTGGGFPEQGNAIVVPQLAAGAAAQIEFAWAPPPPGANLRGDNHFCLLVRLENEADPSGIGEGGWAVVTARNNIALRNVHVQESPAEIAFFVRGSADQDSLIVYPEVLEGEVELRLPIRALPWRDAERLDLSQRRAPYGTRGGRDPLETARLTVRGVDVTVLADVSGADTLSLEHGVARIGAHRTPRVFVPHVRLAEGARMPAYLRVNGAKIDRERRYVHVAQLSGGQLVGGVSLALVAGGGPS